jgi:hypothetical protein
MTRPIRFQTKLRFRCGRNGRKHVEAGEAPAFALEPGRVPWVSKLMALAIRLDGLVRDGVVTDQAELARLGHVTRPRVTQIMNLLHLAPDIQEALLFLPRVERGRDPIQERHLRPIVAVPDWRKQRRMWIALKPQTASIDVV